MIPGPENAPVVTLGLPVFNGERYLESALADLVAQDYPYLEILISDNASTDRTAEICQTFAARDSRIRYVRQATNLGAWKNFEFLVAQARGDYFAWCGHDDSHAPGFARRCAEMLQRHPEAVLCGTQVQFMDEEGALRHDWEDLNFSTLGLGLRKRVNRLIDHMDWVDMLGLARREALQRALPFETVWGSDVVLSMKLLQQGDFCKVEEPLFRYRVRSEPKSIKQTSQVVYGHAQDMRRPYQEMATALLREALRGVEDEALRGGIFLDFVKTMAFLNPKGPHPCWRRVIQKEHKGEPSASASRERFPRSLATWFAEGLDPAHADPGFAALQMALPGVATILVACLSGEAELRLLAEVRQSLHRHFPRARFLALCPDEAALAVARIPGFDAVIPLAGANLDGLNVDLAITLSPTRSGRMDRLITGCGAAITVAIESRLEAVRRLWYRKARGTCDPYLRYTHLLPAEARQAPVDALLRALLLP